MPRSSVLLSAVFLAACQPPPLVGGSGDPSIEIIAPADDVGQIPLQADGSLAFFLSVDVDGIEWVRPSESAGEPVEGEGHFHFHLNNEYIGPPEEQLILFQSEIGEYPVDTAMIVRVSLATNDHVDLDEFVGWEDIVEFTVVAAQ